jgi:hypothetical protein
MRFSRQVKVILIIVVGLSLYIGGCAQQLATPTNTATALPANTIVPATSTVIPPTQTHTQTFTATATVITATPTITPTTEADGCKRPSENYERIAINGRVLNLRTYEMLAYAATLYDGVIDITGTAITQGSYTSAVDASFGTHAGGGAVDLSVMYPETYTIHKEDIEPLIRALRLAGFAAWYRDFDDLYAGSPVHIHAIAIGDAELSFAAQQQLTGPHGYFLGFNGLPPADGRRASIDPHGGPILCAWMIEMGYPDQTATPIP